MLIGVRRSFIFVANTKTASTSIEFMMAQYAEIMRAGSPERKHMKLRDVCKEYWFLFDRPDQPLSRYFKFGVMREPIDWILSWYRYRKGNQVSSRIPRDMSFAEFWAQKDWNIIRADGSKYLQQDLFVGADGAVLADVIIPYAELTPMMEIICKGLNIPLNLNRQNVSSISGLDTPLDPMLVQEMREFYAPDYALFDRLNEINAAGLQKLASRVAARG